MQRLRLTIILCLITAVISGCSKERPEPVKAIPSQAEQMQGYVSVVTSQKLPLSKSKTIGTVFEEYKYFSAREWKESRNSEGKAYVDFRGYLPSVTSGKSGVVREGVEIKFVVSRQGDFYVGMVSRIEVTSDGKVSLYPADDGNKFMELIYANKEIKF